VQQIVKALGIALAAGFILRTPAVSNLAGAVGVNPQQPNSKTNPSAGGSKPSNFGFGGGSGGAGAGKGLIDSLFGNGVMDLRDNSTDANVQAWLDANKIDLSNFPDPLAVGAIGDDPNNLLGGLDFLFKGADGEQDAGGFSIPDPGYFQQDPGLLDFLNISPGDPVLDSVGDPYALDPGFLGDQSNDYEYYL
jgi:hypothetical protein